MGLNFQLAIVSNHLICFALDNSISMPCSICCSAVYHPIDHRSLISSSIFFHFFIRYANATALNRCTKKVRTPTGQDEGCPYTGKLPGHLFSAPPNDPEVNPWVKFQNLRSPLTHQFSILFKKTLHYFFINVL